MSRVCSVEGCEKKVLARGWCSLHYERWRVRGDPLVGAAKVRGVCSVPECSKPHASRGYCATHYKRWRKHGDPLLLLIRPRGSPAAACKIEGCKREAAARDLCSSHYQRWRRHGDPLGGRVSPGEPERYLRETVLSYAGDECLPWPYGRCQGYAVLHTGSEARSTIVSRRVCRAVHGPPPTPKHEAAHSCGKGHEGCVNPNHLRWATHQENMEEMVAHGTAQRGENHGNAKLTAEDVHEIRRLQGKMSQQEIGDLFGVWHSTIWLIHSRKTWAHLPDEEEEPAHVPYLQDVPT